MQNPDDADLDAAPVRIAIATMLSNGDKPHWIYVSRSGFVGFDRESARTMSFGSNGEIALTEVCCCG